MTLIRMTPLRAVTLLSLALSAMVCAGEVRIIEPGQEPVISGKELDWIYGDYLMKNDSVSLIIAAPLATRDANMTIRNIGGSILDMTLNDPSNDQFSAYTSTAGRFLFHDANLVTTGRDGDGVFWQCRSSGSRAHPQTTATVRYRLGNDDAFVLATVTIDGDQAENIVAMDGVRADGWFKFEQKGNLAYCTDEFFRQTIGFKVPGAQQPPTWKQGRPWQLRYADGQVQRSPGRVQWSVLIYPATSLLDLTTITDDSEVTSEMCAFRVAPATQVDQGVDSVNRPKVSVRSISDETTESFPLQTDDHGIAHSRLPPGKYVAVASAIGHDDVEVEFDWPGFEGEVILPLKNASGFKAVVTDDRGGPIPLKATIYSADGEHPNFGLSSARTFVENCVYSVHGKFHCPLEPGKYEIYFSRGPEYNAVTKQVEVLPGRMSTIRVQLDRVVDTTGWVSTDLHSHSSPSGDNTSEQYGRVENLLCEHVEFAPCTEHNRVSSYSPHLQQMKLSHLMATCMGIELTGSPTPVNHQNAFPLHRHPHTQNGGGPSTASNPVVQIERLAMWDDASDKLVQMNHPNLHQIHGDMDTDGIPDKGFRGMLKWTDVIEVHPLETIFQDIGSNPPTGRRKLNAIAQWIQLINQGYRIPGVINTDSHYNHHGSGWHRNWFACSTDDPAKISTEEMVRQAQAGHIVMSTGPFLSVSGASDSNEHSVMPGDDLRAENGKVTLKVRVQCPNWLDVNRVQVFINGRPDERHNYTRRNSPKLFGSLNDVQKFHATLNLGLSEDAHVIVAAIGEGLTMERVMGQRFGNRPPIAVCNPIYVDIDGNGFQPNGDELGLPLPGVKEKR